VNIKNNNRFFQTAVLFVEVVDIPRKGIHLNYIYLFVGRIVLLISFLCSFIPLFGLVSAVVYICCGWEHGNLYFKIFYIPQNYYISRKMNFENLKGVYWHGAFFESAVISTYLFEKNTELVLF